MSDPNTPDSRPIKLFSTDLDGTLLGNPEATLRFATAWAALPAATRPLLVYNSGRLVDEVNTASANIRYEILLPVNIALAGRLRSCGTTIRRMLCGTRGCSKP